MQNLELTRTRRLEFVNYALSQNNCFIIYLTEQSFCLHCEEKKIHKDPYIEELYRGDINIPVLFLQAIILRIF